MKNLKEENNTGKLILWLIESDNRVTFWQKAVDNYDKLNDGYPKKFAIQRMNSWKRMSFKIKKRLEFLKSKGQ